MGDQVTIQSRAAAAITQLLQMVKLWSWLLLAASLYSVGARPQEENMAPVEQEQAQAQDGGMDDMMAADRVIALDDGKEAFQDMVAAVHNADQRVSALSADLDKTISNAQNM